MRSTNVKMQLWLLSKVCRSVINSMPIHCQLPLVIGSGCRRPMGLLLWWLVRWHRLQPTTYRCVSHHICSQKSQSFMCKYIRSAPMYPTAGVLWASWRICCCIVVGIHKHTLFAVFHSSSFSFALIIICTSSSLSFFFALLLCPSSLPLQFSPPASFPNLHVATVGDSPLNATKALAPIICILW